MASRIISSKKAVTKMQAILLVVIIVVVAVIGAVAYMLMQGPTGPIKIGVITPLSAPADYLAGSLIRRTAELFVEAQNKKGGVLGRPLELVVADQTLDAGTAISNLVRMVTNDKIVGLVGPWESGVALPMAEATRQYPTLMFCTYSWADNITANKYPYVFRVGVANLLVSKGTIEWVKIAGYKNAACICEESAYGLGMWEGMNKWRDELYPELKLTLITTKPGKTDYTPELMQISTMDPPPDLIIENENLPHANTMVKQLYEMGLTPKIQLMSSTPFPLWVPDSFWETCGEAGIGMINQDSQSPYVEFTSIGQDFSTLYEADQGSKPPVWIAWYWDCLRILVKAIEDTKSTDINALKDYIENIQIQGTTGFIKFENDPTPGSIMWHKWTGFKFYFFKFEAVGETTEHQIYPPVP